MIRLLKSVSNWPLVARWTYSGNGLSVVTTSLSGTVCKVSFEFADIVHLFERAGRPAFECVVGSLSPEGQFTMQHIRKSVEPSPDAVVHPGLNGQTHLFAAWQNGDDLVIQCSGSSSSFPNFPGDAIDFHEKKDDFRKYMPEIPPIHASLIDGDLVVTVPNCADPVYLTASRGEFHMHFVCYVAPEDNKATARIPMNLPGEGSLTVSHQAGILTAITL